MSTAEVVSAERQAWLQERKGAIGGSDAASLFYRDLDGDGRPIVRYGCALRTWYDKTEHAPDFQRTERENLLLERGTLLEDVVAQLFTARTGLKVRRVARRVSKTHPHVAVSMDRQIVGASLADLQSLWPDTFKDFEGEPGPGYLECKTTNEFELRKMREQGILTDYLIQVQEGLGVTEYRWGAFDVLAPTAWESYAFPVLPQQNLQAEILRRAEEFWTAHVETGVAPLPLERPDKRCTGCLFRASCPLAKQIAEGVPLGNGEYVVDESLAEIAVDLAAAKQMRDDAEERYDAIAAVAKEELGDRQHVLVPSVAKKFRYAWSKPSTTWDTKGLDAELTEEQKKKYKKPKKPSRAFYFEDTCEESA